MKIFGRKIPSHQCPAGRVFQDRVGSGRVLDKIPGSGAGSGQVGVSKIQSGISGYLFYFRVFPGFSGISGMLSEVTRFV